MSQGRRRPTFGSRRVAIPIRRRISVVAPILASLSAALVALPASATTYTPRASIDRTGTKDVTTELQQFLSSVPHHSTITFPAGAKYRIEGTLHVVRRNDLVIDGNGATFFATQPTDDRNRSQWSIEDSSNVLIEEMVIRGANPSGGQADQAYVPALEAQHGINVSGGERIEVRDNTITDVYGDFVYIGRGARPIFGLPTHVWIHHNTFRRDGRQGVSVSTGSDVIIEYNDIADTRRATFDLEPDSNSEIVRDVHIRNNRIGPGRLTFVAAHGRGDVSDLYIENNVLDGKTMGIDLAAPEATRRSNVVITGNTSDARAQSNRGAVMRFVRYDYVDVRNNVQPMAPKQDMHMVGSFDSCKITAANNDLGPNGVGQLEILSDNYDCGSVAGLSRTAATPVFAGQQLTIDVGGMGSPERGVVPCPDAAHCNGYLVGGSAQPVVSSPLRNVSTPDLMYRTMLLGDPQFEIPIRGGTYDVTLSFVEPVADRIAERRFHLDIERQRKLSSFDVFRKAGNAKNTLVQRRFSVTVGDGKLDIDFLWGNTGAIVSLITITRA